MLWGMLSVLTVLVWLKHHLRARSNIHISEDVPRTTTQHFSVRLLIFWTFSEMFRPVWADHFSFFLCRRSLVSTRPQWQRSSETASRCRCFQRSFRVASLVSAVAQAAVLGLLLGTPVLAVVLWLLGKIWCAKGAMVVVHPGSPVLRSSFLSCPNLCDPRIFPPLITLSPDVVL